MKIKDSACSHILFFVTRIYLFKNKSRPVRRLDDRSVEFGQKLGGALAHRSGDDAEQHRVQRVEHDAFDEPGGENRHESVAVQHREPEGVEQHVDGNGDDRLGDEHLDRRRPLVHDQSENQADKGVTDRESREERAGRVDHVAENIGQGADGHTESGPEQDAGGRDGHAVKPDLEGIGDRD